MTEITIPIIPDDEILKDFQKLKEENMERILKAFDISPLLLGRNDNLTREEIRKRYKEFIND